jgi:phage-related protein
MALDPATSSVSAVAQATADLLLAIKQRDTEMNTPAEQVAAENAKVQEIYDAMTQAVAERNIEQVRKNIAASGNTGP